MAGLFHVGKIINDIGMQEAEDKATAPSHKMVFLGLEVNTLDMTLRIPDDKLHTIREELEWWCNATKVNKKQIQRLLGLLNFAAGCIRPGRIYFSRILNFLRECNAVKGKWYLIDEEVRKDIKWWQLCAHNFNGVSLIMNENWEAPDAIFSTDSYLTGGGGWCDREFFHIKYPEWLLEQEADINVLECLMILTALRLWAPKWGRKQILCKCDNDTSVRALKLEWWCNATKVNKKQIQRLLGLLNFAAGCIRPGRIYFSRILNFLRECNAVKGKWYLIDEEVRKDIKWWQLCAHNFNGVSLIMNENWEAPDAIFSTDSCLTGGGGMVR